MDDLEEKIAELTGSEKTTKEILALLPPWMAKSNIVDEASRTCNLCKAKDICHVKRIVQGDLNGYVREGLLFDDFDDIMADLAVICNNFH